MGEPGVRRSCGRQRDSSLIRAVLFFSLQIYGDFAGYSDIARGCSRILGIELIENFGHPYFTTSITMFWRRWHISLSSWLRDYLYIPLGGNRGRPWTVYRNLMITMLLGGLWHGASWNFVIWGGIHGVALALHKLFRSRFPQPDAAAMGTAERWARAVAGWVVTMAVVGVAWVFFRAPDLVGAFDFLAGIITFQQGSIWIPWGPVIWLILLQLFFDVPQFHKKDHTVLTTWLWPVRGLIYAAAIMLIVLVRTDENIPFIYFQF